MRSSHGNPSLTERASSPTHHLPSTRADPPTTRPRSRRSIRATGFGGPFWGTRRAGGDDHGGGAAHVSGAWRGGPGHGGAAAGGGGGAAGRVRPGLRAEGEPGR